MSTKLPLNLAHAARFDACCSRAFGDLSSNEKVRVLICALSGLHECTLDTLSIVTVSAVLTRAVQTAVREYPALSELDLKAEAVILLIKASGIGENNADLIIQGLRFLIVKYITIKDNLTSGVLTEALFEELTKGMSSYLEAESKNIRGQNE